MGITRPQVNQRVWWLAYNGTETRTYRGTVLSRVHKGRVQVRTDEGFNASVAAKRLNPETIPQK